MLRNSHISEIYARKTILLLAKQVQVHKNLIITQTRKTIYGKLHNALSKYCRIKGIISSLDLAAPRVVKCKLNEKRVGTDAT